METLIFVVSLVGLITIGWYLILCLVDWLYSMWVK